MATNFKVRPSVCIAISRQNGNCKVRYSVLKGWIDFSQVLTSSRSVQERVGHAEHGHRLKLARWRTLKKEANNTRTAEAALAQWPPGGARITSRNFVLETNIGCGPFGFFLLREWTFACQQLQFIYKLLLHLFIVSRLLVRDAWKRSVTSGEWAETRVSTLCDKLGFAFQVEGHFYPLTPVSRNSDLTTTPKYETSNYLLPHSCYCWTIFGSNICQVKNF